MRSMNTEFQKKYEEFEKMPATTQDAIRNMKQQELQQLQERIEGFKSSAQESLQKKEQELLDPIYKKAKAAIKAVAKELGYAYVFDTSTGALLDQPDSDDLMNAVKKKLNITGEEKPVSPTPAAPAGGSKPGPKGK